MKKRKRLSNTNCGMTMVEILMGFVILVLILAMLSGVIVVATNIYYSSVDLRRAEESLQEAIYSNSITEDLVPESVSLTLVPSTDMPGDTAPIPISADLYKLSSRSVLEGLEADSLDVNIYFLKEPTDANE